MQIPGIADNVQIVEEILNQRKKVYGSYPDKAEIIQKLKSVLRSSGYWDSLEPVHQESLDNIMQKVGRIMTGDSGYPDNWQDIAGYALLILEKSE